MRHRRLVSAGATILAVGLLSGCSLPWRHSDSSPVSVLEVEVGQCFTPPKEVVDQLSDLQSVPCSSAHTLEAYAAVPYEAAGTAGARADYPGDAALTTFADGACAARYADYVGIDYRDSAYFYTYLLPSPRSWQDKDRTVDCFVTTTGQPLTSSLKGAKK